VDEEEQRRGAEDRGLPEREGVERERGDEGDERGPAGRARDGSARTIVSTPARVQAAQARRCGIAQSGAMIQSIVGE
jgi:hypothetical protein